MLPRILILGLGNELLQDDGVGIHVARELQRKRLPGTRVLEVGTAVLQCLGDLEWADRVIAIDAMKADSPPGSVYLAHRADLKAQSGEMTMHDLNLLAVARMLPADRIPDIVILGVEPAVIDYGMELTPPVREAVVTAASTVRLLVRSWRAAARGKPPDRCSQWPSHVQSGNEDGHLGPASAADRTSVRRPVEP